MIEKKSSIEAGEKLDMASTVQAIEPHDKLAIRIVSKHWRDVWEAAGYPKAAFLEDWQLTTQEFMEAGLTSGLNPKTFVAFDKNNDIVGSVRCQIWEGPVPWVIQPEIFRLGTVWGLYVDEAQVNESVRESIRKNLLESALAHLQNFHCSKVVTLAPTQAHKEAMAKAGVGFQSANMLTLDLNTAAENLQTTEKLDQTRFLCGPVGEEHDLTVCAHWRSMWHDVGFPRETLLPNTDDLTLSFVKKARENLGYQTFVARCVSTQKVVGSISCQIWEGPFPKIVNRDTFQMGTIWAVYVHPGYRRQGVATALMMLALKHLKDIGCRSAILIAASAEGQRVYERLGFRPNNALVADLPPQAINGEKCDRAEVDVAEEKKQEEEPDSSSLKPGNLADLEEALGGLLGTVAKDDNLHIKALSTATQPQLLAVFCDHPQGKEIIDAVVAVQKKHRYFIDPAENWFTQNVSRCGRGFNMKELQRDPVSLAARFDRLSTRYDQWTSSNGSKVESFIVNCARKASQLLSERGDDARVLDVACGIGLMGQVLRLCGFRGQLVGTDVSPGMVQRVMERGCYNDAYVANANESPSNVHGCDDSRFDIIICTGALELLDHSKVLAEMNRLTKPRGEVWLSFQHEKLQNSTEHQNIRGITQDHAVKLLQDAGFGNILSMETCPDAFYTPSPAQDGTLLPVPYLFVVAKKE